MEPGVFQQDFKLTKISFSPCKLECSKKVFFVEPKVFQQDFYFFFSSGTLSLGFTTTSSGKYDISNFLEALQFIEARKVWSSNNF